MLEIKGYKNYGDAKHIKIYLNGEYCADMIYRYTDSNNLYIDMIRVLKKFRRQGIARKMVLYVHDLYPEADYIGGDSKPSVEAMEFWKTMGAEFVRDSEKLVANEELVPFMIFKINK